jgi:hypothetical protein
MKVWKKAKDEGRKPVMAFASMYNPRAPVQTPAVV